MNASSPSNGHNGGGQVTFPDFGALVISLDFELQWGVRHRVPAGGSYHQNILGARRAIPQILDLFEEFGISATWAVVGFLFAWSRAELATFSPVVRPRYADSRFDPYTETVGEDEEDDPLHYAPSLIQAIRVRPGQEIGTHTFSHYCCLEPGHSRESFADDMNSAVAIAASQGICVRSLVFPRNQVNPDYDDVLLQSGVRCYRGFERGRMYSPVPSADQSLVLRSARTWDSYATVGSAQVTPWSEILQCNGLCNVRGSRFLRPCLPHSRPLESLRRRRIVREMQIAAICPGLFHLWWHPHNFGVHTDDNLQFLRRILEAFAQFREEYGMRSLSMGEVADLALGPAAQGSAAPTVAALHQA